MVLNPSSVAPDIVGVATPTTPGDNIVAIATSNSNVTGGNRSIRSSAKLSQKSNRSGKDVSSGMFSSSRNSKGVLKPQTSFSGNKIGYVFLYLHMHTSYTFMNIFLTDF